MPAAGFVRQGAGAVREVACLHHPGTLRAAVVGGPELVEGLRRRPVLKLEHSSEVSTNSSCWSHGHVWRSYLWRRHRPLTQRAKPSDVQHLAWCSMTDPWALSRP